LRFGSSKATAPANLVYPSRKTARKIAAPLARIKTDLILCTELPSELPESDALIVKAYAMSASKTRLTA
jgi:hypothetical protein